MADPLFSGPATVRVSPDGRVRVEPPWDAVIPPGYVMRVTVDERAQAATYEVVPAEGWRCRWLRWRYPYKKGRSS